MLADQANIPTGSYSKYQGVQVEGIKDSSSHTQICTNKMLIFQVGWKIPPPPDSVSPTALYLQPHLKVSRQSHSFTCLQLRNVVPRGMKP